MWQINFHGVRKINATIINMEGEEKLKVKLICALGKMNRQKGAWTDGIEVDVLSALTDFSIYMNTKVINEVYYTDKKQRTELNTYFWHYLSQMRMNTSSIEQSA